MDVEFEFKEKNGGACVTKLLAPGAVCVVLGHFYRLFESI